jgi:hypothetical protein
MGSFPEAMNEYKKQLKNGDIQEAYQGLMAYFRDLSSYFKNKYPEYSISGSIYYGYMDMTYFSLFPESCKRRKLKIAIVFIHDKFQFEVWLATNPKREDYVIDHVLISDPDFHDLDTLTQQIERGTLAFLRDVESFLSKH